MQQLTSRQLEVLYLVCQGCTYEEMADALGLSVSTVIAHVRALQRKLQAPDKRHLIPLGWRLIPEAISDGWVPPIVDRVAS